jgi:hypothetical protein
MNRLERHQLLLRGKRNGCFDADQPYLEAAVRARAARRVRIHLRRLRPVLLLTPRWSRPDRFLDELSVDLQVGRPRVAARVVPLGVVKGRPGHEVSAFLLRSLVEACHLDLEGPASQPMDRAGFREVLGRLLARTADGPRRALLLQGVEHLPVDMLIDLHQVLMEHGRAFGPRRRFTLLFAGAASLPRSELTGLETVVLPDFGVEEAVDALHEYTDRGVRDEVELAAALVGGVPALLHAVGLHASAEGRYPTTQEAIWRALGPLSEELRHAVDIVAADGELAERLEDVARDGTVPMLQRHDARLVQAGLTRPVPGMRRPHVTVRAPVIAQLAGMLVGQQGEVADSLDGPVM